MAHSVSFTCFKHSPRFSPWTGSEPSTRFPGTPCWKGCSTWKGEVGGAVSVPQGRRLGEHTHHGDPLMPILSAWGSMQPCRPSPRDFKTERDPWRSLTTCSLSRSVDVNHIVREELWIHSRIFLHFGKTRIWNLGGVCPNHCEELEVRASTVDPMAMVWMGSHKSSPKEQGINVLGTS